jgi:hypothetical protein
MAYALIRPAMESPQALLAMPEAPFLAPATSLANVRGRGSSATVPMEILSQSIDAGTEPVLTNQTQLGRHVKESPMVRRVAEEGPVNLGRADNRSP